MASKVHVITLEKGIATEDVVEETPIATVHRLATGKYADDVRCLRRSRTASRIDELRTRSIDPDVVHFQETYGFGGPYRGHSDGIHGARVRQPEPGHGKEVAVAIAGAVVAASRRRKASGATGTWCRLPRTLPKRSSRSVTMPTSRPYPNAISPQFFDIESRTPWRDGSCLRDGSIAARTSARRFSAVAQACRDRGMDVSLHAAGEFSG